MKAKFITESELFKGKSEEDLYNSLKDINPLYAKIVAYISTHYTNWSPQVSSTVENHFFRFDLREWPVSFNYMKYRIHCEYGGENVVLGISNDNNRYDYYIVKDFGDFINLMRNKGGRPAIEPARKVKIKESIENVFKPKSEEEIDQNLANDPDYKIGDKKSATEHLLAAINRRNVPYAKYALRHGAKPLYTYVPKTNGSSGNLWAAYNSMGDAEEAQDLIIEMLKSKQITQLYKKFPRFRESVLQKTLYMGMTDVMKWILENFKETTYKDVHNAIQNVGIDWGSSTWTGYQATLDLLIPWLKDRKPIKESVGDILKPKPANEIDRKLKNYSSVFYEIYQEIYNNPAYTNVNINPRRTLGGATGFTLDFEIQDYHFEVIVVNKDKERGWGVYIPKQIIIRHTPPSKIFFLDSVQILNLREFNYYINRALEEKNSMKESISNILKPKSREEIQKALEYTEEDEYTDMVDKEIDRQRVMFGDDTIFSKYRELVDAGFKEKTPPSEVASQIIQSFYQNDWKPDGAMALTNTGGIELKVVDSGDGVEYRFTGEIVPHGAEIEYDYRDEDSEEIDWSEVGSTDEDERESKAFFKDENENKWYLEDFMRIDYPYFG